MHPNKNKSHLTWSNYYVACPKEVSDKELGLGRRRRVGPVRRRSVPVEQQQADEPATVVRRPCIDVVCPGAASKVASDGDETAQRDSGPAERGTVENTTDEGGVGRGWEFNRMSRPCSGSSEKEVKPVCCSTNVHCL